MKNLDIKTTQTLVCNLANNSEIENFWIKSQAKISKFTIFTLPYILYLLNMYISFLVSSDVVTDK